MNIKSLVGWILSARKIRGSTAARYCCYAVCFLAVLEFIVLNIFILYLMSVFSHIFTLPSAHPSASFWNRLQENGFINKLLIDAKSNQVFQRTLQETLERMFIVHSKQDTTGSPQQSFLKDAHGRTMKDISFFGLDVSHSREATYIYNRILSRKSFPYHFMVVDIGANDGFLSSNSFNFIQWGWDAVLVDPQGIELQTAWQNIKSYLDPYMEGNQRVHLVRAAIADEDGSVGFHYSQRGQGTMSHVEYAGVHDRLEDEVQLRVTAMTVKTLAAKYRIPKNFGVLSIDAEGLGLKILRQWLGLGFRPAYIIFEYLSLGEDETVFMHRFHKHGYHILGKRGWNFIFEHESRQPETDASA